MERFLPPQRGYPSVPRGIPGAARQRPTRGLKRSKTLTRPERGVAPPPLIQPTTAPGFSDATPLARGRGSLFVPSSAPIFTGDRKSLWKTSSSIMTFWAPSVLLTHLGRMHMPMKRQAWREKMLVVMAALVLGCVTAFFTVGVNRVMCPNGRDGGPEMTLLGRTAMTLGIRGDLYNISSSATQPSVDFYALAQQLPGQDITPLFQPPSDPAACSGHDGAYASSGLCGNETVRFCVLPQLTSTSIGNLNINKTGMKIGYSWSQMKALPEYIVLNGLVLNLGPYLASNPGSIPGDQVDAIIRQVIGRRGEDGGGKDATRLFTNSPLTLGAIDCLSARYLAGQIDKVAPGCFFASILMYVVLIIVMGIIVIRFGMALVFSWFLAPRMSRPRSPQTVSDQASAIADLFTICLVTCYSEGPSEIRSTLDSITDTTYSDTRKLIFLVCDGLVRGHGES